MELERLKFVRELFSKPENWTKGAYARNDHGVGVLPLSSEATCWCLSGAIQVFNRDNPQAADGAKRVNLMLRRVINEKWKNNSMHQINDEQGREVVLEILDEAISRLETKESVT